MICFNVTSLKINLLNPTHSAPRTFLRKASTSINEMFVQLLPCYIVNVRQKHQFEFKLEEKLLNLS